MYLFHLLVISQIVLQFLQIQFIDYSSKVETNEYLCPFNFLQFGFLQLLPVHASILLLNADWPGTDLRLITTRDPS